jgi:hypothetical protein
VRPSSEYVFTLKKEASYSYETLVVVHKGAQYHITEDRDANTTVSHHRRP